MRGLSALKSGMISQLFRRLPKFGYVGDMATIYTSWYLQLQSNISIHIISALLFAKNLLQALFLLVPCRAIVFSDLKEKS